MQGTPLILALTLHHHARDTANPCSHTAPPRDHPVPLLMHKRPSKDQSAHLGIETSKHLDGQIVIITITQCTCGEEFIELYTVVHTKKLIYSKICSSLLLGTA